MSVPNTTTFSLEDVLNEIFGVGHGHPKSLGDAFTSARANGFDPAYEGSKDRLSNFRNYNHTYFDVSPWTNTLYDFYGDAVSNPNRTIDGAAAWYVIDTGSISGLAFSPSSDPDGYYSGGSHSGTVGSNSNTFCEYGAADFYWTDDDNYAGSINACQDGTVDTCA